MRPQIADLAPPTPRETSEHRGLVRGLLLVMLLVLVLGAFSSPTLAASPHAPTLPHPSVAVGGASTHLPTSATTTTAFPPRSSNFVPNPHASHQVTAPKFAPNGLPVGSATAHASISPTQRALSPYIVALPLAVVVGANPPSGWAPFPVNLTSGVGGGVPPYTYSWNYGDGSPLSGAPDPIHVYNATSAGWVYPRLTVTDSATNSISTSFAVFVGWQSFQVVAAAAPPTGAVPFTTTFYPSVGVARGALSWLWSFGDGPESSRYSTPTHTYNATGTYTASVTVTDAAGDSSSFSLPVYPQGVYFEATVLATPPSGTIPLTVAFQGAATGGNAPYTYSWNFGDGSPASPLQNPSHIYVAASTYTATLTVTDALARTTASSVAISAVASSPPLAASLMALNPSGPLPLSVQFSSAVSGGAPPYFTSIAFGDGSPPSNSPDPVHVYNVSGGTFTVTLGAVDSKGAAVRVTVPINPSQIPLAANVLPSEPLGVLIPGQTLSGTAFAGGGEPPYQFSWTWGDGQNGSIGATVHRTIGDQCLGISPLVMDSIGGLARAPFLGGCPQTLPEQVSLTASPPVGYAPLKVNFNGSVGGSFQTGKLLWDFGDGSTGVGSMPTHVYRLPGTYDARFWTLDGYGNLMSQDLQVTVTSPGGFVIRACCDTGGNTPTWTGFGSNIQSGGTAPFTYLWSFGDGTQSTLTNPTHIYRGAGTFVVNLTVTDSTGLVAGQDLTVRMQGGVFPLGAAISTSVDSGLAPLSVSYQSIVTGGVPPYQYLWGWGDDQATFSSAVNPTHVWNGSGLNYGPSLTVVDSAFDSVNIGTASQTASVPSRVSISASPLSGGVPLTVNFQALPSASARAFAYHWSFGDNSLGSDSPAPVHTYNRTGTYTATVNCLDAEGRYVGTTPVVVNVGINSEAVSVAADPPNGVAPLTVVFYSALASYTTGNWYHWNYGDGSPGSNFPSPTHQYNATGSYTASLTVIDSLGNILRQALAVNVVASSPPLSVSIIPSASIGLGPLPVSFQGFASGGAGGYAYLWNFGDGSPGSRSPFPSHTYNASGFFTAMLQVTSGAATAGVTTSINVFMDPLRVDIAANPLAGPSPLTVAFQGQVSGGSGHHAYFWMFGDGSYSTLANPTHSFATEGMTYNVQVNIQDPFAGSAGASIGVSATTSGPDPELDLWSDHPTGIAPTQVTFGSTANGGIAPYNFTWNFGDGAVGFGPSPTHIYARAGFYGVNCFVRDAQNYVSQSPLQEIIGQGGPLVNVVVSAAPTAGLAPLGVQFSTAVSGGTPPYFYMWNFNDGGGPSGSPDPYHVYNQTGNYFAAVNVFDSVGNQFPGGVNINVQNPNLVVNIVATPTSGQVPLTVAFTPSVGGGVPPYTYSWSFGDGAPISGAVAPTHTYNGSGSFNVQLAVTDASGNTRTAGQSVYVGSGFVPLSVSAQATPATGFSPLTVVFNGAAWGGTGPYSYRWNFGDGSLGSLYADPTHVYNNTGLFTAMLTVTDRNLTTANAQVSVQVAPNGVADSFSFTPAAGVAPLTVAFNGTVSGGVPPYTWSWDFGDGSTSAARNPVHVYNGTGPFTVTLNVRDSMGYGASTTNTVEVGPVPLTLHGTAAPNAGAVPLVVDFSTWAVGGSPGYTYSWTFGDSTSTTGRYVNHTYSATGTYTATETVLDSIGTVAWQSFSINVVPGLVATAGATPTATDVGLPVSFVGSATGGQPGYTYAWAFGDGGTSTAQRPSHAYALAGPYTASLTVTDAIGLTSTSTIGITVNALPTAAGLASPNPADVGTAVAFTGSVSGGTAPLTYSWNYGDGSPSSGYLTPTHVYNVSGTFSAIFTVTDAVGAVSSQPVAVAVNGVPGVTFTAAPSPTDVGTPVSFTSGVTFGTAPYTYAWAFGDSTTSTAANPTHTYTVAAAYTVVLTVTDKLGNSATHTLSLTVNADPIASASGSPTTVDAGVPVAFLGSATLGTMAYGYAWNFADGSSSVVQNPSHAFVAPGSYSVVLTVTDAVGQTSASTVAITVVADPAVTDTASPSPTDVGVPVAFASSLTGGVGPFTYTWNYGDSTPVSHATAPTHIYNVSGTYTATLVVTDAQGVVATAATLPVTVNAALAFTTSVTPGATDAGIGVAFASTASGGTGGLAYAWRFGDGLTSSLARPSHIYAAAGTYTAVLWVNDTVGGTAMASASVLVNAVLAASASATPTATDAGVPVSFTGSETGGTGPYTYLWNFGDGSFSTSATPKHTFSLAGSFPVVLTVNDSVGGTSSSSITVEVAQALAVTGSAAPATTDVGSAVAFGGFSARGTGASTFAWTFGDGSSATGRYANHTYSAPGTFTATLTATDTQGRTGTSVIVVTVNADPTVSLVASPSSLTLGGLVTFSASAAGGTGTLSYSWTGLPSGCASSNSATIVCRPTAVGNSSVKVVVSDSLGVTSSATSTVNVGAKPTPTTSLFGAGGISGELALIAVVVILGLLLLVLLLRNRRGGGKPSTGHAPKPSSSRASSDDLSEPESSSAPAPSSGPEGAGAPGSPDPEASPAPAAEETDPNDYHES